jgi:hypothetical protein
MPTNEMNNNLSTTIVCVINAQSSNKLQYAFVISSEFTGKANLLEKELGDRVCWALDV